MKQIMKEFYTPPQTTSVFIETGSSLCYVSSGTGEQYGDSSSVDMDEDD